jgi:hypothetical protein
MDCRRCGGSGKLSIKLGKPDPQRDTHAPYTGVWCVYPPVTCAVCHGSGKERFKNNHLAMRRIHLNDQGVPTRNTSAIADRDENT